MKLRKRLLAFLLAIVMVCGMLPSTVLAADAEETAPGATMATFYVSPSGSDENDGLSANAPFATLAKARDAVREINSDMTGDIVVYLMDGTWELDETLKFDERDSGTNGFDVRYVAAEGAKPIISGGKTIDAEWEVAEDVDWLQNGLVAYKTHFERNDKIRAIYVNDQRASMTRKTARPKRSAGTYSVTKGQADWAWTSGSKAAGNVFASSFLPANTRNPQNIELESGSTWVKAVVCAASLEDIGNDETQVNFQMPYAAMAQTLSWNCNYNPTGNNDVTNVFEWLSKEGEFYFDQAGSTLYYIPRAGEDMDTAEVIVPVLDQLVNVTGSKPLDTYAENIVFDGIKFAYTDWNLYEVEGSHGNATVQAATVITKYADGNWHNDMYRAYDVPTAAIQVNTAKNIQFINGEISNTGYLGIHLENDVWYCDVSGNYVGQTGGAGIVIGHPQHVYENDPDDYKVGSNGATADKEKFARGTESVPKHINIMNNYLLENCYFFPGNAPITSFYTYDMKVQHNFVYKCSYSGMSIGWGWCEFDGTSSSKLPGKPTTTSRANNVSYNRIEEICSILQDAGGIYTLGQQGNEDWSDVTVMNNNFINCKRVNQGGSTMVNGFHPDEGSAFILMDGNVVTNSIRNVYELNNWQRKHDVIVTNAFSNTNKSETTAPNCTLDMYVNANYTWPIMGYSTVLNSGLEDGFVDMVGKDVIADTEYELASNVKMEAGLTLPRRGLLSAEDTVWLAPQGTTEFVEGPTMTKAAGNEKSIVLPETEGTYKMYIVYADGTVSKASQNTAYVGAAKPATNIADGMEYSVSKSNPLVLELNTETYKFTLNGEAVKNGDKITTEGEWELSVAMIGSTDAPQTIKFSTYISEANKLLPKSVTVKSGVEVKLAANLNDPSLKIWLASQSASAFEESDTMSCVAGDKDVIAAPQAEGVYDLAVVNDLGEILSRSDCTVTVSNAEVPVSDYIMNFAADKGVTEADGAVSGWENTANADEVLTQATASAMPTLQTNEYGKPYLNFNGKQRLVYEGVNFNGKSEMTVIVMSRNNSNSYASASYNQGNGDRFAPIYINEASGWSGLYVTPYQSWIGVRFGTTKSNCYIKTQRGKTNTDVSVVTAVKNGSTESIYDDGAKLYTKTNVSGTSLAGLGNKLSVGCSYSNGDTYFIGDIFEIFIYDRALSDEEVATMTDYLAVKYGYGCAHEYAAVVTEPTCTEEGYTTYTCAKCGDTYVDNKVEALGHDYVDGKCTRCGEAQPPMATFFVSPDGSDENDGTSADKAFASLEKVRDAVREINSDMTGDIVVYLGDGIWELDETLKFDERDSGTNGYVVRYAAAEGAEPIISGGKTLSTKWEVAENVDWLADGLVAYKTRFVRDDKIRAIYVNDQRASMTRKTIRAKRSVGTYAVTKGQADWAWTSGSKPAGNVFDGSILPANTRNPQNIELESGSTWVKALVCAASLEDIGNGETQVNFQMPYAAMAQTLNWNCGYKPTGNNDITNVFEWLSKEGEFYYDQADYTLYYIPRAGEDMDTAEVIVPELDQLVNVTGSKPLDTYAENIVFDGIKFAYTDWNLYEVEGSHGNATVQAATVITKYADGNWHNDIYRAYDVPTAAIQVNTAKNIQFINGEISNTGYLGIHLENDVWDCDVTGNYIGQTGGAGIVIGHPQHVYENDTDDYKVGNNGATADKEKFARGTESVPKHIKITNNYLLENCYFFPGNAPITSFYTYDMKVLNNFIYKCSYSGMSIGWGWCEWDGTSSSKLPGKPTTTSRANIVSNNRIEEICSILQDAGGIYTLGQQGNDDWTEATYMNNNYINAKRAKQNADGSRMVNGFHPDEGSAFIKMDGNVVTNIIRNVYELNNYQRKHDVIVTNAFSNTNRSETTAPNCSVDMYVNADYTWPILGYTTVLNSGLEDAYVGMVSKDVIADTEYELASNVKMEAGLTLPRRGLLSAEDTVWLAPEGTTEFVEGPTMTKAAGNEKSIVLPETEGAYKLYIVYADGTVSKASQNTAYVGAAKPATNVDDGESYSVSANNPLILELNTDTYKFNLNGEAVKNGEKITTEGEWELVITMIGSTDEPKTVNFTTYISEANKLLPKNVAVKSGEDIQLAANLNDSSLKIWIASQSVSAFEEGKNMTCVAGDKDVIAAPKEAGVYDLAVVNEDGEILSRSDAIVKVLDANVNYVLADSVEAGKQYVIVSNGYALTNKVAQVSTAYNKTSLGSTPVTVENDAITSEVTEDMIWDFEAGQNEFAGEFTTGYYLSNMGGKFLSRNGPTNGNPAPLNTATYDSSNVATKPQWCYWIVKDLDEVGNKAVFLAATGEWSFALRGAADGFDAPGNSADNLNALLSANPVQLYEVVDASLPSIDFKLDTDEEKAKYSIVNPVDSKIDEEKGLYMITTKDGFETAGGQLKGDAATTPKDLVLVPVGGDWTATLKFDFDKAKASNGYYQFFGFYAMEDYNNAVGIRGGDGAMQDFLRVDGNITADTDLKSGPGLSENGTYWYRIVKEGTTYTCLRSSDGEDFTEMFKFADTGIEAENIAIDAYTGMTAGYTFYLDTLTFEGGTKPAGCKHDYAAVVTEPTCTEAGYTTYTCSKCGDSYVADEVAALGHDYKAGEKVEPTCTEDGYTTYTCARCEDSYKGDVVKALGHDYVDGKCTRCGEEQPPMATFFVSPDGSDENDGTSADKAFASLEKVRDAVREINSDMTGDIVVYLGDGTWELDETLKFDERDSGTNGYVVRYAAAEGAKPVISGGKTLSTKWEVAENVDWLQNGLVAYKTRFVRDDKIRAIYVNDQRASMTRKTARPKRAAAEKYAVTKGQADWAWTSGSKAAGNVFASDFLPANTRNPQNIELESGSTWVKAVVCAASLEDIGNGETQVNFQMPYAAMAQTLSWNCNYNPTGNNDVTNVFEWLSKEGEFYFDQADSTLYYIPRAGEDMDTAEVVVPVLDQLVNITGSKPLDTYAENIVFDGIKFAYTDWNLYEVEGSHGNATVQAATVITKYADGNWHNDMYRAYDVPTAAIQVNTAKNIKFINGNISNTGYLGIHLENDVWDCDVTGNYVGQTGGAGIVIGHPQHVYENDTDDYRVGNGATADKEKFARGTESVPKHINITNNYLLENCYFFPGNAPITSFYTYDMKVLNNFVYKCSYSGMSIGWGWCEFDGTSSSKLPGKPTTTSRANTVSNNRIEEICSILQDAGGIYTLGQQGNDDWTDVTVMNNNFINAQRTNTAASGSRMVNGFHPDEGSAYILMDGNVVTNTIRNVYELNNWQRKHDVIVTNAFSNTNKSETTAPNCTLDMYVDANYTWPILGYTTVLNSGLEDAYVGMVSKDVIGDTEYELASNVKMESGLSLPRRGLLSAEDTVWLAPEGTTEFVEGPTMTKAAGNEKSIVLPETEGTYKLYIVYADGTVSKASQNTAYVGAAKPATNIVDGMEYSVSKNNPLVLELNDDTYKFTLNGEAVKNGEKIITEGEWELVITMIGSTDAPQTIKFSTYISEANKLLPKNVTVKSGEAIQLAANLNDPSLKIWIASQSASAFEEGKTMTCVAGDKDVIAAPKEAGVYDLAVVNENGEILSRSDAIVKVLASGASVVTIDFKKEEDADKYDIVNKTSAEIVEDKGLYLITTKDGFETANGQLSGDAATNPKDLVIVPVEGNWTATLKFDFDPANASNGYYQFFGFYAMEDYNNAAGIRSGDGALQNFLRVDGNITADSADLNSGPGLSQKGTYWQRIVKEGDTYTCYRSADGEDFTEIFKYEATGIEAESIAIDAYTGMTAGYTFYLDTLTIEGEDNSLPNIDFKDPADAEKYDIINKDVSEIDEEKGLYMITTKDGFETAGGQLKGDAATTPKDLVLVPVGGDWAATLKFDFDKAKASNGYYQFFGFYAMEDYNNAVGIRGGDGAMQDFLRVDGNITADTDLKSGPGLSENGTYWFRIEKEGTTYTCLRSSDGEDFTEMFKFADTGIEAENIAIDAYTGMTAGYTFYLDTLTFEGGTKPAGCKHDYAAVVTEPTCTEAGYTTYTCSKCGDSYVADEVAALGHDYKAGEKVEPTCTEDGYTTYTCARCEDSYKGDVVKALGHDYKAGEKVEPTCTEDGYTTYTCARCEDSYKGDVVKALGHDYKAVVTEPTCTEAGYTTYTCARCEDSYVDDEVEALGHDYVDGKCTRCGEIDPEYQPEDPSEALKAAQAAAKAAQEAQKAAEAAQKAAEEAAKAAAADSSAAEAAKAAAKAAQDKAEAAQAAAEAAKKAAEAADADAAIKAAESAASAAESAASAAEAAKAQAASAQAQAKAEAAEKAAEEAQKKADEAAQKGEAAAAEAAAAKKAAEDAKKAAEDAKAAADLSADAADKANAEAAEAAAKAAADAAKIADALKEVAAAQAEVAAALEKAAKDAADAEADRKAAEAAQKAAEEAAKAAKEAELNAAKYNALSKAALAAAGAEDVDPAVFKAGIEAIEAAEDVAAVEAALADLLEKLDAAENECPSAKFTDAPAKDNWAHEGIDYCIANEYMNGTAANVFSPEGTVTRAQLVTILYRVAGSPETEFKGTFSDVADGQWYSAAIEWAAANGVVLGVGEGKFAPDGEITREQIATILFRYSKAAKVEGDLKAFPDGDTAGDFAVDGLVWAVSEGLITGVKNGDVTTLAPKDNATRAQIAAIIMRFLDGSFDCK